MILRVLRLIRAYFAIIVVAGTFSWAALIIFSRRAEETPPGTITLRIGHWQLETGVRDAFKQMAQDYQKINPKVRVVQDAIPETTYGQWVTTQLMGGTAPDLMELAMHLPYNIWLSYYNRYIIPLTQYVNTPNPYNQGTELEGVPLRHTFKDGMRVAYVDEMQEYIGMPLSQFGVRVFYNKDLLKKLTGLDQAPQNYQEFLAVCEKIKQQKDAQGRHYVPIACSKYHMSSWDSMMFDPITYPAIQYADFNRDGFVGNDELYVAVRTGRINFDFPGFRAKFQLLREMSDYFQTGYTGVLRDEAVFLIAQGRAVFMSTGTWDLRSLQQQAEGRFEVGVMDFPRPGKDDPYFGDLAENLTYEKAPGGFMFGITRTSKHPDVALDFLLFLAGQKQDEKMNRIIGWIPSVIGTSMDPLLEEFQPNLEGAYSAWNPHLGGETTIKYVQLYSLFQVRQISYDELLAEFEPFYKEQGYKDFMEQQKDWRRGMHNNERFLAGIRAKALLSEGEKALSGWVKYRTLTAARQVWPEIGHNRQMRLIHDGPDLKAVGPYEYSTEVLQQIRQRIGSPT